MAVETIGANTASSFGTSVTASVTAHTKGAYTQLVASTSAACKAVLVAVVGGNNSSDYLVDIATGAASSEAVVIADIPFTRGLAHWHVAYAFFPCAIAAGTRVSARCQSNTSSGNILISCYLLSGTVSPLGDSAAPIAYGVNTVDSGGVSVDPGASINTKGAYSEITSSTSAELTWLTVCAANQINTVRSDVSWLVDIATGAGGAESVVINNINFTSHSAADSIFPSSVTFPLTIANGTRIAARAQCSNNDATDRLLDIIVYGSAPSASGGGGGGFSAFIK